MASKKALWLKLEFCYKKEIQKYICYTKIKKKKKKEKHQSTFFSLYVDDSQILVEHLFDYLKCLKKKKCNYSHDYSTKEKKNICCKINILAA